MVHPAQREQVVGGGEATVLPVPDVVHLEAVPLLAPRHGTSAVAVLDESPDPSADDALEPPDVHRDAIGLQHRTDGAIPRVQAPQVVGQRGPEVEVERVAAARSTREVGVDEVAVGTRRRRRPVRQRSLDERHQSVDQRDLGPRIFGTELLLRPAVQVVSPGSYRRLERRCEVIRQVDRRRPAVLPVTHAELGPLLHRSPPGPHVATALHPGGPVVAARTGTAAARGTSVTAPCGSFGLLLLCVGLLRSRPGTARRAAFVVLVVVTAPSTRSRVRLGLWLLDVEVVPGHAPPELADRRHRSELQGTRLVLVWHVTGDQPSALQREPAFAECRDRRIERNRTPRQVDDRGRRLPRQRRLPREPMMRRVKTHTRPHAVGQHIGHETDHPPVTGVHHPAHLRQLLTGDVVQLALARHAAPAVADTNRSIRR